MVDKGRKAGDCGQGSRDGLGGSEFLVMSSPEQLHQHGVAFILMQEFIARHIPREEKVEMVLIGEGRSRGIAPLLGIEMQADDEIGADHGIHQAGSVSDLADAIKQPLCLELQTG